MSNTTIQIKRSLGPGATAVPISLNPGELAYSSNTGVLYIGNTANVVAIGGNRSPGVLTANQGMTVNSSSWIDVVQTTKLVVGAVGTTINVTAINTTSTSSLLGAASNTELATTWAIQNYVSLSTVNTIGSFTLSGNLVFAGANNTFNTGFTIGAVPGAIGNSVSSNTTTILIGNSSIASTLNATSFSGTANNALNLGGAAAAAYQLNSTLAANVATMTANNSTNLGGVVSTNYVTITGNYTLGGNNVFAGTNTNITSNATFTGANTNINSTNTNITSNTTLAGTNTVVTSNLAITGALITTTANIVSTGLNTNVVNLNVSGNLNVTGTLIALNSATLDIGTNMIELADAQANTTVYTDAASFGWYGLYGNTLTTWYTGVFRDQSDNGVFKFFKTQKAPTATVDTANSTYAVGTVKSYLSTGGAGLTGLITNATNIAIVANSTMAVSITANTLTLATPLAGTSGGTGLASFSANSILVANSTNGFGALALGSDGNILQIQAGTVTWGFLDAGVF